MQRRGHVCYIVKMHYLFKNFLLYSQAQNRQSNYRVIISNEGSTKFVNFMILEAGVLVLGCGHISYIVKINYFYEKLPLYPKVEIKKLEGILMINKEGSTKIVNFMIPRAGIIVLGRGQISQNYYFFFENLLLFIQAQIRLIESIVLVATEESTKNCTLIHPLGRGSCAGAW